MPDQLPPIDKARKPRTQQRLTKSQAELKTAIMSEFGDNLKAWRERKFEHAKDMAIALGIDDDRYRHYERGSAMPPYEVLYRICQILDCEPNDLLPFKKKRSESNARPPRERAVS